MSGAICGCGHTHITSVSEDGADAGCEQLGENCDCWYWHPVDCVTCDQLVSAIKDFGTKDINDNATMRSVVHRVHTEALEGRGG